jgi:hypothetical protein
MELDEQHWRNKFTSIKAAKSSTAKSSFKYRQPEIKNYDHPDKAAKSSILISKSSSRNIPATFSHSFKNRLISHYNQLRVK